MTRTHLSRLSRRVTTVATVLALVVLAGCRNRRSHTPVLPPLGPGPILTIGVPGAVALEPVIATRPPLVAVAFATRDSRGPLVYLSTSTDNGASFSEPQPITSERTDSRYDRLRLSFKSVDGSLANPRPVLELEWQSVDGTLASQTAEPWKGSDAAPATERQQPVIVTATPRTSCSADGEALLVGAEASFVAINHSLTDEACVPGELAAVSDSRKWIHAAWIGRTAEAAHPRVFYASSSHGSGFGFSQVLADNRPNASHLRVVTDPNETVVAVWDETDDDSNKEVWLRQLIPSHFGPATLLPLTRLSSQNGGESPALASIRGGVIAAWVLPRSGFLAIRRVGLDALCTEPSAVQTETDSSAAIIPPANEAATAATRGERRE